LFGGGLGEQISWGKIAQKVAKHSFLVKIDTHFLSGKSIQKN
jgi:hypothetical protein